MRPALLALLLAVMILPGCRHTPDEALEAPVPSPPPEVSVGPSPSPGPAGLGLGQGWTRLLVIDDETEEPVPGATVRVLVQKGHHSCYPRYVIAETSVTDQDGVAALGNHAANPWFAVSAGGYCDQRPLDSSDIPDGVVRLVPGVAISGVVRLPDGRPAPKAILSTSWLGEKSGGFAYSQSGSSVRPDGTFTTATLKHGSWEIRASLEIEGTRHSARRLVRAGDRGVSLVLTPED